jgi:hypothetical protein
MNKNKKAENAALVVRYRDLQAKIQQGKASAREKREADQVGIDILGRFEPLIRTMVRRYRSFAREEIRQEASLALLSVIQQPTLDIERGDELAGLVARAVQCHLKKSTSRTASPVSTGAGNQYRRLRALVLQEKGKGRTIEEICEVAAEKLSASAEDVRAMLAALEPAADYDVALAETGTDTHEALRHQRDARDHLNRALGDLPEPVRLAWRLQHGYLSDTHSIQLNAREITDMLNRLGLSTCAGKEFSISAVNDLVRRANKGLRKVLAAHRDDLLAA